MLKFKPFKMWQMNFMQVGNSSGTNNRGGFLCHHLPLTSTTSDIRFFKGLHVNCDVILLNILKMITKLHVHVLILCRNIIQGKLTVFIRY